MKRKLLALLITLAMLGGTYSTIPAIISHMNIGTQKASHGELDLSKWRFAEDGVAKLDGEWEFYPNLLLGAQDFTGGSFPSPQMIAVPGSWSSKMDTLGKATYRLRVHISDGDQVYGLKTLNIQMSGRIFVNGQVIGSSGSPAEKQSYVGINKPIVSYFTMRPGLNEVIVQVANYHSPSSSGIFNSIYLGYQQQISELHSKALSHDWVMFTSYLIMALYFIGLYTQRRRDHILIIFGLMSLLFAVYVSTKGERIIYDLFGSLPVWLFLRIQILAIIGSGMTMLLYVYVAFRAFCFQQFIRIALLAGAILAILELVFFTSIQNGVMQPITTLYAIVPFFYVLYVLLLAALHKVEGSLYLFVAAIAHNALAFFRILNSYFAVPVYTFPPVENFVYLLMLALLMSLRFSNAFKQVEQLSGRLIHADKLKDEFLTKTAHEFKTPLHGMMNIAQSVIEDRRHPLTPEQQDHVGLISATAKRLSQLVYDILDLAKLKEGELAVVSVPIHVSSTVEVILKVFSFLTTGKDLRLVNSVPDDLPYVLADEIRFRQIISNLLDNAIKHTEYGSIEVLAAEIDGMIEISVKDTGKGMDESDLSVIFEPYKSLETDSNQSFGLGLPIVKQLVELQHGEIRVFSEKGAGSTFSFRLPLAGDDDRSNDIAHLTTWNVEPLMPEYSFPTPYVSQHKGGYTILAVDDNFSNLKVLIDSLERLDYTVIAVKNGYEALQQMENQRVVDLVILDLMMPGLSGFEVCLAIRSKFNLLELPILMVTASIQPEDKIAAFEAGANDYLPKPFDAAELRARAKSLLTMKESVGKAVDMEVAFLQSQIKPHFLYNVLNTIMALSYMDAAKSRKLTAELADYLRGSFSFSNTQKGVPFSSELALIRSYVEIEQVRFEDNVRVEYDIAEEAMAVKLPPLLIQPLVENAIRHGIGSLVDGGTINVRAFKVEDYYIFEVEDDGVGMTEEQLEEALGSEPFEQQASRSGVGLKNISKRLKFAYGTELNVQSSVGVGTKVTMRISAEPA